MGSSWIIHVGPKSSKFPYTRCTDGRHTEKRGEGHLEMEVEIGVIQYMEPPEIGRGKEGFSRGFGDIVKFQNCGKINFSYF